MGFSLSSLAEHVDGAVVGDGAALVHQLGSLENAKPGDLTHLSSPRYRRFLADTRASCVLLRQQDLADCPTHAIVVANPYHAFAVLSQLFERRPNQADSISDTAHVDPAARLAPDVKVGPNATIMAAAVLEAGVVIGAGAFVGEGVTLGADTIVMPNATLCYGVCVGAGCVIHSGAVIGADGFGFTPDASGRLQAIAQIGGVVIGNEVNVGANTTIDRGAIDDTVVEDGVKIDNQVQIGHNCRIGAHSVICGCVGIVGSTKIGRHVVLAGGVGVGGDGPIEICDQVVVSGMTHVSRTISEPGVYSGGVLHNENRRWKRNALRFTELDAMAKRLNRVERMLRGSAAEEKNLSS